MGYITNTNLAAACCFGYNKTELISWIILIFWLENRSKNKLNNSWYYIKASWQYYGILDSWY